MLLAIASPLALPSPRADVLRNQGSDEQQAQKQGQQDAQQQHVLAPQWEQMASVAPNCPLGKRNARKEECKDAIEATAKDILHWKILEDGEDSGAPHGCSFNTDTKTVVWNEGVGGNEIGSYRLACTEVPDELPLTLHLIWWTGGAEHKLSAINLCAIDRFHARNPGVPIWLWTDSTSYLGPPQIMDLVTQKKLSPPELFYKTPLEGWSPTEAQKQRQRQQGPKRNCFTAQNYANAARLAILYKYGGVYMDMDLIAVAPFPEPLAAISCQTNVRDGGCAKFNNELMYFPAGDHCLHEMIRDFRDRFDNCHWGKNGPDMVTRVLNDHKNHATCKHVKIFPMEAFAPVPWQHVNSMTTEMPNELDYAGMPRNATGTYGVHTYSRVCSPECHTTFVHAYCPELEPDGAEERELELSGSFYQGARDDPFALLTWLTQNIQR